MTEPETRYLVLARKHRPAAFSGLIGQDAMVRTLKNAIATGRLAQAFILTGVRGVGKTTTARIIARALNCVGPDGSGGPTAQPCGVCEHCRAISEDRHVDVIEMDAASRTGVEDIRELIEGVRYRPVSARYKIYIIDEVHMLSKQAFNALLKTLEEPPEHVKFIFATTEIRRVPITVLSRCQRFDLKRVEFEILSEHLTRIAKDEGVNIAPEAITLIARAADGSVRDGLSLLDTAIARGPEEGGGLIEPAQIRDMLGLADRSRVIELFDKVMAGETEAALGIVAELYQNGADPAVVVSDLLEICHWLTRLKLVPGTANAPEIPAAERKRGDDMAAKLAVPALARAWQMLLKGLAEVQAAPNPLPAAEMILVRLSYAAELPTPAEMVERLEGADAGTPASGGTPRPAPRPSGASRRSESAGTAPSFGPESYADERPRAFAGMGAVAVPARQPETAGEAAPAPQSFEEAVALFDINREAVLHAHLVTDVHPVRFEPGRIDIRPGRNAPGNLANRMSELLRKWTGRQWVVTISQETGKPTLKEEAEAEVTRAHERAAADPLVRAVLDTFPGSRIEAVHPREEGGEA